MLGVDVNETKDEIRQYRDRMHPTFPMAMDLDGSAQRSFMHEYGIPYNVVIDRKMKIRYSEAGFNQKKLLEAVTASLAEAGR